MHLSPHDRIWEDMFEPSKGDVRGFLFDPASMDLEPQCGYCHQPLPVQPRAGF